jgi:uncharacterized damage-inducible protein DinB
MSTPLPEIVTLREHLERFRAVTLEMLTMVPDEKLAWRPAENLRSLSEQFLHIAQVEDFYARGFPADDWDFDRLKRPAGELTPEALRAWLTEPRGFLLEGLEKLDAAKRDSIPQVPNVPVPWTLRSWLWYLIEHVVHHKAQLELYMREVRLKPPFFAFVFAGGFRPEAG